MVDSAVVGGVGGAEDAEVPAEEIFAEGAYADVIVGVGAAVPIVLSLLIALGVDCAHVDPIVGNAHFHGVLPLALDSA